MRSVSTCLALTALMLGICVASPAQTYKFSTLYNFRANNQGTAPSFPTSLTVDATGNLYGTASGGKNADGIVFELSPRGVFTVLHTFNGTDGIDPKSLIRDTKGNLYGATENTGSSATVFKMLKGSGATYTLTTLYSAQFAEPDALSLDSKGNLYGTDSNNRGCICVFEIPAGGQWEDIYATSGQPTYVVGNALVDRNGGIYASLDYEGNGGGGQIIEVNGDGYFYLPPGDLGSAYLRQDAVGNIYGLAWGDDQYTFGAVFKIELSTGAVSNTYNFTGGVSGRNPFGLFSIDSTGNVYGVAQLGASGTGVVFKVTPQGQETVLYAFPANTYVSYGLVMDTAGNLYGLTTAGGKYNAGTLYKLALTK